ncbi:MAG: hypothetical protein KDJ88_05535 [Bauldia sp.]|nr:hypothetical protein [Bauldia sp.]
MFYRFLRFRTPTGAAAALMAILVVSATAGSVRAEVTTPPRGSPLRAAILDGLRPMVEAEVGAPVEFVVEDLRVIGEWAFAYVTPQRPGGGEIFYVYTRYQAAVDEGMFDDQVYALLRETPAGWLVYEYRLGATDVPWLEWGRLYPVPWEVFPGR